MSNESKAKGLRSIDIISLLKPRAAWRLMRGMGRAAVEKDFAGLPLAVCWFTNFSCNAACAFCCKAAEVRAGREAFAPLSPDRADQLLRRIRASVDLLYLSGGEPTIHPGIVDILQAGRELGFSSVGISSNLIALDGKPEVLDYIDAIGVSLHGPNPQEHARALRVPVSVGERVFENLELLSGRQDRLRVLVNCVVTAENLGHVREMLDFTGERGFLLEVVPANENGRPADALRSSVAYRRLIDDLLVMRREGRAANLAGSTYYYERIRDFEPFRCFPYGVPNVMPDGRLCTPCDVSKQYGVNVLDWPDLKSAMEASLGGLGAYPCRNGQCFKAGIVERSRLFGLFAQGASEAD